MTQREKRTTAEWFTFALSSMVVLGVVALIGTQLLDGHDPPVISARATTPVRQAGDRYYVPVEVENAGDETAANVQITVSLTIDDEVVTEADQTVDFLAGGETASLVFAFDEDPDDGELDVQATGYEEP